MHAQGFVPHQIAIHMGRSRKAVVRWLGEIGVELPPPRKLRPRGVTPPYVWGARRSSDGKRISCSLYESWHSMRVRCRAPGYRDYKYYGGRGIKVCTEWDDYAAFRAWALSHGFGKDLTLDRENSNGNYEPGNCRWATREVQTYNSSRTAQITFMGETLPGPVLAKRFGLSPNQLRMRLRQGWSAERALTTPIRNQSLGFRRCVTR
jgi:hypothetical protein